MRLYRGIRSLSGLTVAKYDASPLGNQWRKRVCGPSDRQCDKCDSGSVPPKNIWPWNTGLDRTFVSAVERGSPKPLSLGAIEAGALSTFRPRASPLRSYAVRMTMLTRPPLP